MWQRIKNWGRETVVETQKEFSRLWQLSVLGINAGFDRAFRDLEKRGGGAVWALLIAGIFGWQFGLVAGANWLIFLLFLFYGWDSRVVAGGALLYLASCPFLLSFKQDAWAEAMAVQAYFFLVMTVTLQMVEYRRDTRGKKQGAENKIQAKKINFQFLKNIEKLKHVSINYSDALILFGLAVLIMGGMLAPGYVLTLDGIFTPEMKVYPSDEGFNNALPMNWLIYVATLVLPAWLVQKFFLLALFFAIGYGAFRFLPVGKNRTVRFFGALVFLFNPFVYSRFIAGHWFHLFGYAFLPLLVNRLWLFGRKNTYREALGVMGALFVISLFSIHFFLMGALLTGVWFGFLLFAQWKKKNSLARRVENILLCGVGLISVSLWWLIPALNRPAAIEARFDAAHWEAFAAGGYKWVDPFLNVLSMNGFWGERNFWAKSFLWPQDYATFWMAMTVLAVLVVSAIRLGWRDEKRKIKIRFFVLLGAAAFVFSLGVSETVFGGLNRWLFEHMPFWSGFRDSQKWSGLLVLSYAVLGAEGLRALLPRLKKKGWDFSGVRSWFLFAVPLLLGFLLWFGLWGQVKPVFYPESWQTTKNYLDERKAAALFLPWHGYMSFGWDDNLILANPVKRYFGERHFFGKSVELGEIYDQEKDEKYSELDELIRDEEAPDDLLDFLLENNIKYIVHFKDLGDKDTLNYPALDSARAKIVSESEDVVLYMIEK